MPSHRYGVFILKRIYRKILVHGAYWIAAGAVGLLSVAYAKIISLSQSAYFHQSSSHPAIFFLITPIFFLVAAALVVFLAPQAGGSGIPQILKAIKLSHSPQEIATLSSLVSLRTAAVKILSSTVGVLGGASIGREGPTVQIASSVFAWFGSKGRKFTHLHDLESLLIAGGAAGVAAAFNTPLAGIAFAIEEIAENSFKHFKRYVMLSVIIAGITAQAIVGDYLYFGHLPNRHSNWLIRPEAILIGLVAGALGGIFSRLLAIDTKNIFQLKWWQKALICGLICAGLNYISRGTTSGSSYELMEEFINLKRDDIPSIFFLEKIVSTLFSFQSGMAGGIFSPCLSIGAAIGYLAGKLALFTNLRVCSLIGMVAFFAGTVQAPLTAVIIVTEMTDEHILILPFMMAAFISHGISKFLAPTPLYSYLAFGSSKGTNSKLEDV